MDILNFKNIDPNRTSIEQWENRDSSFFSDVYQSAEKLLRRLVCESASGDAARNESAPYEHLNRLIAFTGDRGSGKTSAMYTFVTACQKGEFNCAGLFCLLPVIEPIHFKGEESLTGAVVSHLYSMLEKILEESQGNDPGSDKQLREILTHFTAVREALRVQGQSASQLLEQNNDELTHLRMLAQSSRLREAFRQLVSSFLCFWKQKKCSSDCRGRKPFLLIAIDDMDTAISSAYPLIEELYHNLMLPDVIVVMALKLEQLSDALEERFIDKLSWLWKASQNGTYALMDAQPAEMAMQYILKVIPRQCRVEMPSPSHIARGARIASEDGKGDWSVSGYFVAEIQRKTGVLLVPDPNGVHALIPTNLRSLHQLYLMLDGMRDLDSPEGTANKQQLARTQLRTFEAWIFERLSASQLDSSLLEILRQFSSHANQDASAFLWRSLVKYCSMRGEYYTQEVSELLERRTLNENITMGDVFRLLHLLQQTYAENGASLLLPAVRALYSIKIKSVIYDDANFESAADNPPGTNLTEEGYRQIQSILNGLIYDSAMKVTYDGLERIFNRDATMGTVLISPKRPEQENSSDQPAHGTHTGKDGQGAGQLVNLRGSLLTKQTAKQADSMSIKDAVWISLFITACGRVKGEDLHMLDFSALHSVLASASRYQADDGVPAFVSANWMAFIHNLLTPADAAQRILWQVSNTPEQLQPNKYEDVGEAIQRAVTDWQSCRAALLFGALHVDSADFLDEMVWYMMHHVDKVIRRQKDNIAVMRGYFDFAAGLCDAVQEVEKRLRSSAKSPFSKGENAGTDSIRAFLRVEELKEQKNRDKFAWLGEY